MQGHIFRIHQKGQQIKRKARSSQFECLNCSYKTYDKNKFKVHSRRKHDVKCETCDYTTTSKILLNKHEENVHGKHSQCLYCEFTASKKEIKEHITECHSDKAPNECPQCSHIARDGQSLARHILGKHKNGKIQYDCQQCFYTTFTKSQFDQHVLLPHDVKCKDCDYATTSATLLYSHLQAAHQKDTLKKCLYCDYSGSANDVKEHENQNHNDGAQNQCPDCEYAHKHRYKLWQHIAEIHKKVKDFKCMICEFASATEERLKRHFKTVHDKDNNKLNCEHCDFITPKRVLLQRHTYLQHKEHSEIRCNSCELAFPNKWSKKRHMKSGHTMKIKCEKCDYVAKDKYRMKTHVLGVHEKSKDHKCLHCDFAATFKFQLIHHEERVHKKTYKCEICDFSALNKLDLQDHILTAHENEVNEHQCLQCDYACSRASKMKFHIQENHKKEDTFDCAYCDFNCSAKYLLKEHISEAHEGDLTDDDEYFNEETVYEINNNDDMKPYKCKKCGHTTRTKDHMKKHFSHNHDKERRCSICNFITKDKFDMKEHIQDAHMDEENKYNCTDCDFKTNLMTSLQASLQWLLPLQHRTTKKISI